MRGKIMPFLGTAAGILAIVFCLALTGCVTDKTTNMQPPATATGTIPVVATSAPSSSSPSPAPITASPIASTATPAVSPSATPTVTPDAVKSPSPTIALNVNPPSSVAVTTDDEFINALKNKKTNKIYIVGKIKLPNGALNTVQRAGKTITITPDAELTIDDLNFVVNGPIVNHGKLIVSGRLLVYADGLLTDESIGDYTVVGTGEISRMTAVINSQKLNKYLSSFYTTVGFPVSKKSNLVIGKDVVVPEGKKLWLNMYCSLEIKRGCTLTVDGTVEMFSSAKFVNKGKLVGAITWQN